MKQLVLLKMQMILNVHFLPGVTNTVAKPTIQYEWIDNGKTLICRQLTLMISWAYTIQKSQGKTLNIAIIYLGKSESFPGMTLVTLYCARNLSCLLLCPISL